MCNYNDDEERHPNEEQITRREAIAKIGKYGAFVPATLAVLTAAPRAFAQSGDTDTFHISGRNLCAGVPQTNRPTALTLESTSGTLTFYTTTDADGVFEFTEEIPKGSSGTWSISLMPSSYPNRSGDYPPLSLDLGEINYCII